MAKKKFKITGQMIGLVIVGIAIGLLAANSAKQDFHFNPAKYSDIGTFEVATTNYGFAYGNALAICEYNDINNGFDSNKWLCYPKVVESTRTVCECRTYGER